jgi:N-methylhydantoinase B
VDDRVVYRAHPSRNARRGDPITTEVVRHALNSVAEQMKRTLIRTAFSPIIYEVLDFAVAIYDRDVRLLAQAPSLPLFMGRLSFCVEGAVEAAGGEEALEPGDILLYNVPYGTGSHPQDAALVMPAFIDGMIAGYAAVKGHWLDIGGKEPYSTDTVDVFQEGTIFPGVKLFARGERVADIMRMATANSRVPRMVAGDIAAEAAAVRIGAQGLTSLIERHGHADFWAAVERMLDHGEAVVRRFFKRIPDGRYVGRGVMDDNGVGHERLPLDIAVEVSGSEVVVDFSGAPDQQPGPINCPFPKTVATSRVAIATLAGANEATNDGHFRPLTIVARRGSLFHPVHPAPTFIGGWPAFQAIEAIYGALAQALPDAVPACSGGDICSLVWWGTREATSEPWADGSPHPVGQGAHAAGDGASSLMHISEAATRIAPVEVSEAQNPWLVERWELAPDSCGPGRHRGGLGADLVVRVLEDAWLTAVIERTTTAPWGLSGGGTARPNGGTLRLPDGSERLVGKGTRLRLPRGATFKLSTGGGGGFGSPAEREATAIERDLADGYISRAHARRHYTHALPD